MIMMMMMIHY